MLYKLDLDALDIITMTKRLLLRHAGQAGSCRTRELHGTWHEQEECNDEQCI
jgi:hypothetical protein